MGTRCKGLGRSRRRGAKLLQLVDPNRPLDVLQLMFARVLEGYVDLASHLSVSVVGDADAARLGDAFEPRSDVDAVAENVTVFDDDVTDVDTDTELDALVGSHSLVALGHTALLLDGAADGVHRANEFDQNPVACTFDDASAMFGDVWLEKFKAVRVEARERALLVGPHKPAVADDITGENG